MRCPKCDTINSDEARYCVSCSTALALACALCGTELPLEARFCFHCGAPVRSPGAGTDGAPMASAVSPHEREEFDRAIQRLVPKEFAERLLVVGLGLLGVAGYYALLVYLGSEDPLHPLIHRFDLHLAGSEIHMQGLMGVAPVDLGQFVCQGRFQG